MTKRRSKKESPSESVDKAIKSGVKSEEQAKKAYLSGSEFFKIAKNQKWPSAVLSL